MVQLTSITLAIIFSFVILLANCASNTFAQETTNSKAPQVSPKRIQEKIETRQENLEMKVASKEAARKERLETKEENLEAKILNNKERIATKEAALKKRLAMFKNKKRASAAASVSANLNRINKQKTNLILEHLNKMKELLDKLEARLQQTSQIDATSIQIEINKARTDIAIAEAATISQAEKDYTLTITTENKVKEDAYSIRNNLHVDLKTIHDAVVTARKSVASAISTTVSTLKGISNGK